MEETEKIEDIKKYIKKYKEFIREKSQKSSGNYSFFQWEWDAIQRIIGKIKDDEEAMAVLCHIIDYAMIKNNVN